MKFNVECWEPAYDIEGISMQDILDCCPLQPEGPGHKYRQQAKYNRKVYDVLVHLNVGQVVSLEPFGNTYTRVE